MTIDQNKLEELIRVFLEENTKINLSAFRTPEHCRIGNVMDSVAILDAFSEAEWKSVSAILDIGTGGGFPLLPLSIALPSTKLVGIDSTGKKIDAVKRIVSSLQVQNAELHAGRLEDLARDEKFAESFDMVTARALAPLPVLLEYTAAFLKIGGIAAFWKSTKVADELASSARAQQILHMSYQRMFEYELPENFGKRAIVFFKKIARTSKEYPRKTGIPAQRPL